MNTHWYIPGFFRYQRPILFMNRRQLCDFCVISKRQQPTNRCFRCDPGCLPYMAGYKIAILLTRGRVQAGVRALPRACTGNTCVFFRRSYMAHHKIARLLMRVTGIFANLCNKIRCRLVSGREIAIPFLHFLTNLAVHSRSKLALFRILFR